MNLAFTPEQEAFRKEVRDFLAANCDRAAIRRLETSDLGYSTEHWRKMAEMEVRQAMNTQDNLTAMELAKLEVETGERFGVSTGTGINP